MEFDKLSIKLPMAKHEFDLLEVSSSSSLVVERAQIEDAERACQLVDDELPGGVSAADLVQNVISRNSDNAFVFRRNDVIVGFYAMLMLRPLGLERLLLGEFDGTQPEWVCLAETGEVPAGIYVWGYVAPGLAAEGIRHVSQFLKQPKYRHVNYFARPVTKAGIRITENLGFRPITCGAKGLYRYVRLINRTPEWMCMTRENRR